MSRSEHRSTHNVNLVRAQAYLREYLSQNPQEELSPCFSPVQPEPEPSKVKYEILASSIDPLLEELACLDPDVEDNKRSLEDIFEAMQDEFSPLVTLDVMHSLTATKLELSRKIQAQPIPEPIEETSDDAPCEAKSESAAPLSMTSFSEQYSFLKGKIQAKTSAVFELTQHERNLIKPPNDEDDIVMSEPCMTQDSLERPPPCTEDPEENEDEEETPKGRKRGKRGNPDFSNIGLKPKR